MQFSSPFDAPKNHKTTIDPEQQKLLRELEKRCKFVKRDTDNLQALRGKKKIRDAAEMAENAKLVREKLAKQNKKLVEEAKTTKMDDDQTAKDLKDEVQQLRQTVCDLKEELRAQKSFTSDSTLRERQMNTENLCSVTKTTSSTFKSSKAYFEELIKSSSDVSANVTARGRSCGWVRNATKLTSSRSMAYDRTSAKKRPSVLKGDDAEYCTSESGGESHGISLKCQKCELPNDDELKNVLSPKTSDFGSDGQSCEIVNHDKRTASCSRKPGEIVNREEPIRLEISLADSESQWAQNMAVQKCRSNTCADHVPLENTVKIIEIKLETSMRNVNEFMSTDVKQNTSDGRERSENATDASAAAVTSTACTFSDCVCRLIKADSVGTQGGSSDDCKNNGRSRDRRGLVKQTEQCSGAPDKFPKKIDHRSRVDKTNNCSTSSKRSDKPNVASEEKKEKQTVVRTECDRVATRSAVPLDQRLSDCFELMKQYAASASTRRGIDGLSSGNRMKTLVNRNSACRYCGGADGIHNDQVIRWSHDNPCPEKGQHYHKL